MSYKTSLLKLAIKCAPIKLILWVANIKLKGIAELIVFRFDLDARTAHVQTLLFGEAEPIDVWVDGFGIMSNEQSYQFIIQQAKSNKPWLNNILAHIVGKAWKIPAIPQLAAQMELIAELLKLDNPEQQDN
jgi:hypothetical protein